MLRRPGLKPRGELHLALQEVLPVVEDGIGPCRGAGRKVGQGAVAVEPAALRRIGDVPTHGVEPAPMWCPVMGEREIAPLQHLVAFIVAIAHTRRARAGDLAAVIDLVDRRVAVEDFGGESDLVIVGGPPDELAETVPGSRAHRIEFVARERTGGRAAPDAAVGTRGRQGRLVGAAMADRKDALQGRAELEGGHAGLGQSPVEAVERGLQARRPGPLAAAQQVVRIHGAEGDDATERVGTPEHRTRTAHDLDRAHVGQIDEIAGAIGDPFDDARAVDPDLDAVAGDATNGETAEIAPGVGARGDAVDADAGFVTDEILNVAAAAVVHALARNDRHIGGNVEPLALLARRRHRDLVSRRGIGCRRCGLRDRGGRRQTQDSHRNRGAQRPAMQPCHCPKPFPSLVVRCAGWLRRMAFGWLAWRVGPAARPAGYKSGFLESTICPRKRHICHSRNSTIQF